MSTAQYIYKIAPAKPIPEWPAHDHADKSNPILPSSSLDKSSNFIHMSRAIQIAGTLRHFFASNVSEQSSIWLLKVRISSRMEEQNVLRWESPDASICGARDGEGLFPHLYMEDNVSENTKSRTSCRLWLS